jgi:hypothetical protein
MSALLALARLLLSGWWAIDGWLAVIEEWIAQRRAGEAA